jgi:general secretion pathway protein D
MKTLSPWSLLLCLVLATSPTFAQRRPLNPPPAGDRQINPQPNTATPGGVGAPRADGRNTPTCEEARRRARYGIYFDKVDIEKLVQTVSDATCKTFILPENVRGKISIVGPENGRVEVDSDQFYAAFLAALDANGLSVYPHGRFLKIVDKRSAKQNPIPTIVDAETPYTTNEQMVTKLFKIKYVEVEPLRGVLQQLVSKDGDTIPYPPDTVIINDVGSNMHRLERIITQLDTRASSDELRIVQVQFATAQDVAGTVQKLFESKSRPGQRTGGFVPSVSPGAPPGEIPGGPPGVGDAATGPVTLSQIIPDERTNKLIIVASPAAFERILQIVREVDVPTDAGGRINVYPLENADAEELASTLQTLAQGTANRPRTPSPIQPPAGARPTTTAAELFSGEVKISADKSTNSLVIVASQSDFKNIVRVIEQLDIPRRQVFVEAVIMEVNLDRNSEFGINFHSGYRLTTDQGAVPGLFGTKYTKQGLPPSFSLANLASFGGFLAGLQGPVIPELQRLGIDIPAFGVVMHALQQSSDVNVLSTPHILTSDNEEAEITVGQNVPFQAGFSPGSLGGGLGIPGTGTGTGGVPSSLLGGLGGLGSLFAPITRQNVELKLTVKPQINESDFIRMVITEQTEEIASSDPVLGPTTSKRTAKTTVVAKDSETVVIGGIMQDRTIESVSKVPVLGDIPIVGHLFRDTTRRKTKTNLLLFLTPYIIKDQSDFRAIFERKMRERQQFVEQFYGQVAGYDVPVDFSRKPGPLSRMNQAVLREQQRLENGGPGSPGERLIKPSGSVAPGRPGAQAPAGAQGGQGTMVAPAAQPAPMETGTEVREAPPPPQGSEESVPTPESTERLKIQPDTGEGERAP